MANASWLDPEALEPDADDENEVWHVVVSEGEVKTLTLEQLDDLFRLDVIDVTTKVWGPDMKGWTTLGEALGVDGDDGEEISVVTDDFAVANPYDRPTAKQALPPPPFAPAGGRGALPRLVAVPEPDSRPRSYSPPPKLTPYAAVAVEDYRGDVETVAKAYVPPPRLQATHPPVNIPKATQPFGVAPRPVSPFAVSASAIPQAPVPRSAQAYNAPRPQPASVFPPVVEAPGASLRPAAMDIAPPSRARRDSIRAFASDPDIYVRRPSRFGTWLMVAAVLSGAAVTLYRNDLLRDLAHRAGQDAAYARLEAALGGPAFGTPRSVEHAATHEAAAPALGARSVLPEATEPKAEAPIAEPKKAEAPKAEAEKPALPKAVSIDALPQEAPRAASIRETAKTPEPAAPVAKKAPAPIAEPAPKKETPAPRAKAMAAASVTRAEPKKEAPAPKPAPARAKAAEPDEPLPGLPPSLDEAIRDRMMNGKKKSPSPSPAAAPAKKKKSGNDYDPLNSDL